MRDESLDNGLILLRSSRLEALLDPLLELLEQTRPNNPLAPQTLIAAHPGVKQWLTGALARRVGAGGIVANLDVKLPSRWLDDLSIDLLGERAVALPKYRRGHLRWTLHARLGDPERHGVSDRRVLDYLGTGSGRSADELALRRFQLADRLARVYSQYLVYRSDWLDAWQAGKFTFATARQEDPALRVLEAGCLAPLWKSLSDALGEHRGRLVEELVKVLGNSGDALPPLHVVGLSHLPSVELSVLRAYAQRAPVFLYVPDPCREFWGGLRKASERGGWRLLDTAEWKAWCDEEEQLLKNPDAAGWREQTHPLLARWGRLGQHFFSALVDGEVREDIRHWQDEASPEPRNRLQRLQESIRRLQPELLKEDPTAADAAADASLRIHSCHTRQRELEVLRDALLDAIEHEHVGAGGIVVMAPDIQAYVPLIRAVFGEPGSARERLLPYHLADAPPSRSHPLLAVFQALLGMGGSRVTAPEVADLLAVAEVRRALKLDENDVGVLIEWLRDSGVAWALDGDHKRALALPARPENSFAWALDRMLAGYLMADAANGDGEQGVSLPDGTELLPMAGIDGPSAAALGGLDRLLCELQAWRDLAQSERKAGEWAVMLRARADALLRIDPRDASARAAMSVLHRAIEQIATEPERNGEEPTLRMQVVRELLEESLGSASERQRFLLGGITFCGMVPQRAIPFDVICVLGLDEGAFPRRSADGGVDLMTRIRRIGDRDVAGDDRYLFLETVMSARKRLHLSHVGQGVRDGKRRNPAAPLAELMAELDQHAKIAPDNEEIARPWLVRHPLQPFDARYFDGENPALFSYSAAFAGMAGAGREPPRRLHDPAQPLAVAQCDVLPLDLLAAYFKDPAKALLQGNLHLALDGLDADERLPEDEPLDAVARIHVTARRVFLEHVLPRKCADPDWAWDRQSPAWLRLGGLLPLGEIGASAWETEAAAVDALWSRVADSARFDARGAGGGKTLSVDVLLRQPSDPEAEPGLPQRIAGKVRNIYPLRDSEAGVQVVFAFPSADAKGKGLRKPDALGFHHLVPAFLQWALLRLQRSDDASPVPVRLTLLADGEPDMGIRINAWDAGYCDADPATRAGMDAELRQRLRGLVALWREGMAGTLWFYPATAWSAMREEAKLRGKIGQGEPEGDATASEDLLPIVAGKIAGRWAGGSDGHSGERDYAPGYAAFLEGDLMFGDPHSDPRGAALKSLLDTAHRINALILLDAGNTSAQPAGGAA